jgi:hypothetical protein
LCTRHTQRLRAGLMNVGALGGWMEVVLLRNECQLGDAKCLIVSKWIRPPSKSRSFATLRMTSYIRNICL